MATFHYFAYGSNLHPLRLQNRVPSASVIGVVEVKGRKLTFAKKSTDGSGKCSFYESGNPEDVVFGVLYELDSTDKEKLDRAEAKGKGYNEQLVSFKFNGIRYTPFTYIADSQYIDGSLQPYEWYKQFVVEGAKYHSMPEEYVSWIKSFSAKPDLNVNRNSKNMTMLNDMKEFN